MDIYDFLYSLRKTYYLLEKTNKTISFEIANATESKNQLERTSNENNIVELRKSIDECIMELNAMNKDLMEVKNSIKDLYNKTLQHETSSFIRVLKHRRLNCHHQKVQKNYQSLNQHSEYIKNSIMERFGKYISETKFEKPLSEIYHFDTPVVYYDILKKNLPQDKERSLAVTAITRNNGEIHTVAESEINLVEIVHEYLHYLSKNGNWSGIFYFKERDLFHSKPKSNGHSEMNEAITELFTQHILGNKYFSNSKYESNKNAISLIESTIGEDIIAKAYFQNRAELIDDNFIKVLGKESYNTFLNNFAMAQSENSKTNKPFSDARDKTISTFITLYKK